MAKSSKKKKTKKKNNQKHNASSVNGRSGSVNSRKNHVPKGTGSPASSVKLSQCMIVKNEEKNIEQALSWGKGYVCEQIVVDTGSTDKTVEIAEQMGAKVYHFEWNDNFAAAKNYAIEQANGNWIAFLDADEFLPEEDAKKVMKCLQEAHPHQEIDFLRTKIVNLNESGEIMGAFPQDRFFRNVPGLRYQYRIHETLMYVKKKKLLAYDVQDKITILHTGYGAHISRPDKGERNIRMLKTDLEENPQNAMRLMYLGDAYNIQEKKADALACYRKLLWNDIRKPADIASADDEIAYIRAGLQIMRIRHSEPASETKDEFLKINETLKSYGGDSHPDLDYYTAIMYFRDGDMKQSAELFERALQKLEHYTGADVTTMTGDLEVPNKVIAMQALSEGNLQKAVQYAVKALQVNKYSGDAIKILIVAFKMEHKPGMGAESYWQFLCKMYDSNNLKDLMFLYRFAGEEGFTELAELAYEAIPPEVRGQIE